MPPRQALARSTEQPRVDRKMAILLAAERLFAQHGYRVVTLRRIAQEAEVPLALVDYYFGQKHELFRAVFERWRGTLDERLRLLDEARRSAPADELLRRVTEAFVLPVLRLRASDTGEAYAQLVARELLYRTPECHQMLTDYFDPMAHAFIDALQALSPGRSRGEAAWAYQFALGVLLHHIVDERVERLSRGRDHPRDPAAAPLLVDFICAGIGAVLAPPPARARAANPRRHR